jgi:hypothetical protein
MPKLLLAIESALILPRDRIKKTEKEGKHWEKEEKTMKLNLIFIVMELLTLLAYPIVFLHGKLRKFSKSKGSIPLANRLVTSSVTSGR